MIRFAKLGGGWAASIGLCVLLATNCWGANAATKRVVFLNNTDSPFWDACSNGLNEGEKQFDLAGAGLKVSWQSNDGTAQGQITKLRQFGTESDIAAVAISVIQADNEAIVNELKKLQAKGIKIITVDGDVNRKKFPGARSHYIGTDNTFGGKILGKCAQTLLESKNVASGGYVQFAGYTDNDNARSRMDGVKESLDAKKFTELDRMPDETDRTKARDNVRNAITNHKKNLAALLGIWSYNAPAIAEVATQMKVRDKLVIATFDAEEGAIQQMTLGKIDVMVVQDPYAMGLQTAKLLKAMVKGDEAEINKVFTDLNQKPGDQLNTGLRVVAPDANTPLNAKQFDGQPVEFMTLTEFKAWLKKYNLKSS